MRSPAGDTDKEAKPMVASTQNAQHTLKEAMRSLPDVHVTPTKPTHDHNRDDSRLFDSSSPMITVRMPAREVNNEWEFDVGLNRFYLICDFGTTGCSFRFQVSDIEKPHPAEVSGASENPKLRLTGIPCEVRAKIFHHILVDTHPIKLEVSCNAYDSNVKEWKSHRKSEERRGYGYQAKTTLTNISREDTKALLLVSREVYKEGCEILFGRNRWTCDSAHWLEKVFFKDSNFGIGTRNAVFIKDLTLELPLGLRGNTEPPFLLVAAFVDFICNDLPRLRKLRLYTSMTSWLHRLPRDWLDQPIVDTAIERRALCTVGRITEKHKILRKAIWTAKKDRTISVTLVPPRREVQEVPMPKLDNSDGNAIGSAWTSHKTFVLDCAKIRKNNWYELFGQEASHFALPDTVISSEPSTVALESEDEIGCSVIHDGIAGS